MSFHKINRILKHPRRADQSAMCAINRHLLDDRGILLRQGSKELDSSCSRERSSPVMLSAAKPLATGHDRSFAALSMTWGDGSHGQGLFFTIEPCLKFMIGHRGIFDRLFR